MPISSSTSSSYSSKTKASRKKSGSGGLFTFTCGCKDSMPVTPSPSNSSVSAATTTTTSTSNSGRRKALTSLSTSTSSSYVLQQEHKQSKSHGVVGIDAEEEEEEAVEEQHERQLSNGSCPSFSGLLRELNDLEQSVMEWKPETVCSEETRSVLSNSRSIDRRKGKVEESVAVVTETEDPVGDFRRSMLTMIVENQIDAEEELRDLLGRFLSLNSPQNHHLILRAFAHVWDDVFSSHNDNAAEVLRRRRGSSDMLTFSF